METLERLGASRKQFCSKLGIILKDNDTYHKVIELVDEYSQRMVRDKHIEDTIRLEKAIEIATKEKEKKLKEERIKRQTEILGRKPTAGELAMFEEYEEMMNREKYF